MDEKNWCVYCGTWLGPWPRDELGLSRMGATLQCPKCGKLTHYDSGRMFPPYAQGGNPLRCPNCEYVHGLDIAGDLWGENPPLPCPQCGFDLRSPFTTRQPWKTSPSSPQAPQGQGKSTSTFPRTQPNTSYPTQKQSQPSGTTPSFPPRTFPQGAQTGQVIPPTQAPQFRTQSQPRTTPAPSPAPDWPQPTSQGLGKTGAWLISILLTGLSLFGGFFLGSVAMVSMGFGILPVMGGFPSLAATLIPIISAIIFTAITLGFIVPPIWKKVSWRYGGQGCSRVAVWLIRIVLLMAILLLCVLSIAIIDDSAIWGSGGLGRSPFSFFNVENMNNPNQSNFDQASPTNPSQMGYELTQGLPVPSETAILPLTQMGNQPTQDQSGQSEPVILPQVDYELTEEPQVQATTAIPPQIFNEPTQDLPIGGETEVPPEGEVHALPPSTHFPLVLVNQTNRDICFLKFNSWESYRPSLTENILELANIMFAQGETIEILLMQFGDPSEDYDQYYATIYGTTDFQMGVKLLDVRYNPRTVDRWVHACGVFSTWERQYFSIELPNDGYVLLP